ncbi:hypothetical protein V3C99_004371 [Haemonchus contortus]
MVPEMA